MRHNSIFISLILFMGFICGLTFSNAPTLFASNNTVTAREFHIVDNAGIPRGGLFFDDSGNPAFYLANKQKEVRAYIALTKTGPIMVFRDHEGQKRIVLDYNESEGPSFGLIGAGGDPKIVQAVVNDKKPTISLMKAKKIAGGTWSANEKGSIFSLLTKDNKPAVMLTSGYGNNSVCTFYGSDERPKFLLGMAGSTPLLSAFDADNSGLLFNVPSGNRSQLALFANGTPVWSATGDVPAAPELPLTDDIMRELMR